MTITIVTTAFNSAATIRDTIESVLQQTYRDIEYWIIDGGSKDATMDIVCSYEAAFEGRMHWISEPDKGIYDAMNKGILHATGDVIGFINSDDVLANKDVIETIASRFIETNTSCVFGNLLMVKEDNLDSVFRVWKGSRYTDNGFIKGWHPAHPTFYCKRECYERFGLYDISYKIASDFELMLRFIEKNKISTSFIDEYLVKMRMGGASTGSIHNIMLGRDDILRAFKENGYKINPLLYYTKRITPKILNVLKTKIIKSHK